MNKVAVLVLGGFVGLAIGIVALPRGDYRLPPAARHASLRGAPASSVAPTAAATTAPASTASPTGSAAPGADDGQVPEIALEPAETMDAAEQAAASASGVPSLNNAPKHVTFGVVLVSYAGAQGAPRDARSKADAEKLAAELAEVARTDFAAALKKGDKGSIDDAGKMYRGILEPAAEYALFSLEPDQVSAPVDTPRGFWILRRIK
ncbi:MAG: peptidyl-prolyl cis-trans isomerase [Deltaproteobacteria bacterium]|nr:peptidyl-prolyl cis-trans isomerase [Deltaproteobacteria bacterium]